MDTCLDLHQIDQAQRKDCTCLAGQGIAGPAEDSLDLGLGEHHLAFAHHTLDWDGSLDLVVACLHADPFDHNLASAVGELAVVAGPAAEPTVDHRMLLVA